VPRHATPEQLEAERARFEEALNRLDALAAKELDAND
jgi:hypothetical protein